MIDGIYHVKFSSSTHDFGEGIAVFKGDAVNGGDHGYTYTGVKTPGPQFRSRLTITQWNNAVPSVFGPARQFALELDGTAHGDSFTATGHVVGQPQLKINIIGKFLASAA